MFDKLNSFRISFKTPAHIGVVYIYKVFQILESTATILILLLTKSNPIPIQGSNLILCLEINEIY